MLPVFIAGSLAAISSAGIPFTIGFLGKELIYEGTLNSGNMYIFLTIAAVITNILLLYAGFVAGIRPFTGKLPKVFKNVHLPPLLMWLPPLLLGAGSLIFGVFPGIIDKVLVQSTVLAMHGVADGVDLKLWHGFNTVLLLSAVTLLVGISLYFILQPGQKKQTFISQFQPASPQRLIRRSAGLVGSFSSWYTGVFQNGYLRTYVIIIISFLIALLSYKLFTGVNLYIDYSKLQQVTPYEAVVTGVMLIAIFKTIQTSSRLIAVASMGVVGYCICLIFVFYGAPDLAMTQFSIDTLTVVLFVLVLFRLPSFSNLSTTGIKIRDGIVALSFGTLISIMVLEVLNESVTKETTHYYVENAYKLAKGKNIVNVILVDFRGLDTLVEITVLTIAAIGVFSMLKLKISAEAKE
jgi:multicomponent Na+:H+ antiporter subunit A